MSSGRLPAILGAVIVALAASPAFADWQYLLDAFRPDGSIITTYGADATPAANCSRRICSNFRMCGHTLWSDADIKAANEGASYFALRETSTGNLVC